MKRGWSRCITIGSAAVLILSTVLLTYACLAPGAHMEYRSNFDSVSLQGTMTCLETDESGQLTSDYDFDEYGNKTYIFEGYFNKNIPENEEVMLKLGNLKADIWINGIKVLDWGNEEKYIGISETAGNVWQSFTSEGISTKDNVQIQLKSIYNSGNHKRFNDFFANIYYGSERGLYMQEIRRVAFKVVIGILEIAFGLFLFIIIAIMRGMKINGDKSLVWLADFTTITGIWMTLDFDLVNLIIPYPVFLNILDIICTLLMPLCLLMYLKPVFLGKKRLMFNWCVTFLIVTDIVLIALQSVGISDIYEVQPFVASIIAFSCAFSVIGLAHEGWIAKNIEAKKKFVSFAPLYIGALGEIISYIILRGGLGNFLGLGLIITAAIQIATIIKQIAEELNKAKQIENEILRSREAVMFSQIQPHFLYNALNTIKYLSRTDTEAAGEAIDSFAKYLRGNMDSLINSELISFERELAHLNNYIHIELLRFGDKMDVEIDIKATDFYLPALTVQPLVENAIKHGVTKKVKGGMVRILNYEKENGWYIEIEDDGVGFDIKTFEKNKSEYKSKGIENVRRRLEIQCKGELRIFSKCNEGTKAVVFIPRRQGEVKDESYSSRR